MRKIAFVVLVLAIALPAMAVNDVVLSFTKTPLDVNAVTLHYVINNSKEVRAFALDITVTDSAYVVGSAVSLSNDYYIHPTNITFDVNAGGITYIKANGSPVVNETVNGFTIEMASLYKLAPDPDPNHPSAPPAVGDLIKFYVKNTCAGNTDHKIKFTVAQNTQRGGIVMKDPNVGPVGVTLPSTSFYIPCLDCSCMVVGGSCFGYPINQARYDRWVLYGRPGSWCHPGHKYGDANFDCMVSSVDALGPALPNFSAAWAAEWPAAAYQPGCDVNMDGMISSSDITGSATYGSGLGRNWGADVPTCP
jgi:hypothetical protein